MTVSFKRMMLPVFLIAISLVGKGCKKDGGFFELDASLQTQTFDCLGGESSFPVNTNTSFTAKVTSGTEWIHLIIPGMSVTSVVDPLPLGEDDRTGTFDIKTGAGTKTVTVTQKAITWESVPDVVSLNNGTLSFSVTITSSRRIRFDLPDWISPEDTAWVHGRKTYVFTADVFMDPLEANRSTSVTVRTADTGNPISRDIKVEQDSYVNDGIQTIAQLWATDPMGFPKEGTTRYSLLEKIDEICGQCDRYPFSYNYLPADAKYAEQLEQDYHILSIYHYAFDKVLEEIKNSDVADGTTRIWPLYNDGYIFKTPSACWGMDINHKYANLLEPYLDFITVSHNDGDHVETTLMSAMVSKGKPVITNFYAGSSEYRSTITGTTYRIGNITLTTAITDEYNDPDHPNCMTVFRVETGADGGNLRYVHVGDSDCDPNRFGPIQGPIDVAFLRGIGAKSEVRALGTGENQIEPTYIILGHQQELRHYISQSPQRATIIWTIKNVHNYYGAYENRSSIPFWGTSLIWDGKTLKKYE